MSEEMNSAASEVSNITMSLIFDQLRERVSMYNAKLLLQSAAVRTGLNADNPEPLSKEQAKAICLELINNGGPAFQVGKTVYQTLQ
ncbi:MAG: hypothetical protein H6626_08700 [Pseudobdellovibrionaceae bacterium]|nr:hypothetical protein [Bdellovibrionales bacterium]USN46294.1 MAG: hypothetical protein H6626_08700 [Pseudobdellovibrionaceae bacterium]